MMQRHKVPRAILEPLARSQQDSCLYVWVLCGARRYTREERERLEACMSAPQQGPVVWSKLVHRVVDAIDIPD